MSCKRHYININTGFSISFLKDFKKFAPTAPSTERWSTERVTFITVATSISPLSFTIGFLAPCPTSGQVIYSENDELVTKESIDELDKRIKSQKGVEVIFSKIKNSNHFFKNKEKELSLEIEKYLKEKTALI